jgi:hypothetical protein
MRAASLTKSLSKRKFRAIVFTGTPVGIRFYGELPKGNGYCCSSANLYLDSIYVGWDQFPVPKPSSGDKKSKKDKPSDTKKDDKEKEKKGKKDDEDEDEEEEDEDGIFDSFDLIRVTILTLQKR